MFSLKHVNPCSMSNYGEAVFVFLNIIFSN